MSHRFVGQITIPAGALTTVDTAKKHVLGTHAFDEEGNQYLYLQGVASVAAGDLVAYKNDFTTARLNKTAADLLWPCAVAMAAVVADCYGWFLVCGVADDIGGSVLASCAANVALYTSGTDGALDDTSSSQTKINRAVLGTAQGAAAGLNKTLIVNWPSAN